MADANIQRFLQAARKRRQLYYNARNRTEALRQRVAQDDPLVDVLQENIKEPHREIVPLCMVVFVVLVAGVDVAVEVAQLREGPPNYTLFYGMVVSHFAITACFAIPIYLYGRRRRRIALAAAAVSTAALERADVTLCRC